MTFPCYPKYKASGFIWLGEVPEHWVLKRLGHYFEERRERASDTEFEPLSVTKYGIVPRLESAAKTQDGDNRKKVLAGDFVINSRSDRKGSSGLSPLDGSVSLICTVLIPTGLHGPFIHHLFRSELFQEEYYRWGKGIVADLWSTNFSDMKNIVLGVPPEAEQTQIARFLDHETARIDALIEEQQRLIELLKEKRQAVISHVVTKGLDPTVSMKNSGVEWLGEVPAHWVVAGLKWFWSVTDCKHITAEFVDEGIPLASIREVQSRYVALDNAKQTTEVFYRQLIEGGRELVAGDLIFSRNATVGEVAQVANWHPPFAMGQDVCVLKKQYQWLSSDYLQAVLRSPVVMAQLDNLMIGSTFKRVNVEDIRGIIVPMPPQGEQKIIAEYLIQETEIFDSLLSEAQNTIGLLQERRSALISAAVTGKIDVRGWQPPASAKAPEHTTQMTA